MMIIDPDREGCTIWTYSGFQYIKGSVEECCERIIKYFTYVFNGDISHFAKRSPIKIDAAGIGMVYADYFKHRGIEYEVIKAINIL